MPVAGRARALVAVEHPGLVWLLSAVHGVNEFFNIILPPLFPFLVPALGISYADAGFLVVAFFATYSVAQLPVGRVVDVYSPRRLLAGGLLLLSVGVGLVGLAPSFPVMVAGMIVAGLGGSTYHPTGMSVISDVETTSTHGRSMGIHGMLGTLGPVAAPVLVTAVAFAAGWRAALLAASGLGVALAVLVYVAYPRVTHAPPPDRGLVDAVRGDLTGETAVGIARRTGAFLWSPIVLGLVGLFVVVGAEVRAVQTFTPVFASELVGTDPAFGNAMLAVTMIAAALASSIAGYGVDRVDRRVFATACLVGTATVVAWLVIAPPPRQWLPVAFVLLGVVMYSIYPLVNALAAANATAERSGSLFAVTQTAAAVGSALGPLAVGVVADAHGLAAGFGVTAGIALCGLLVLVAVARSIG